MEERSNFLPNLTTGYGAMLVFGALQYPFSQNQIDHFVFPVDARRTDSLSGILATRNPRSSNLDAHCRHVRFALCIGGTRFFMVMSDGLIMHRRC